MKKLIALLVLLTASLAYGQQAVSNKPDCVVGFSFNAATRSNAYDNRQSGCTKWSLTYYNTGFSALSIEPDFAPDSGGQPGSWTVWPSANVATGLLPLTATTESQVTVGLFHPWVSVNLNSITGTGTISGVMYGWKSTPVDDSASFAYSSLDPCSNPNITKLSAIVNISTATSTQIIPLQAGQKTFVCQFAFTVTGTSPTFAFQRGTGSACGTGTTLLTGTFAPTTGVYIASPGGPGTAIQGTAGSQTCILSGGTTPSIQGYVSYVQQ